VVYKLDQKVRFGKETLYIELKHLGILQPLKANMADIVYSLLIVFTLPKPKDSVGAILGPYYPRL
jgi:hypothetical protein